MNEHSDRDKSEQPSRWRIPFDPPYYRDDLPQLDALHSHIGLGPEWLASEERAYIAQREPTPPTDPS